MRAPRPVDPLSIRCVLHTAFDGDAPRHMFMSNDTRAHSHNVHFAPKIRAAPRQSCLQRRRQSAVPSCKTNSRRLPANSDSVPRPRWAIIWGVPFRFWRTALALALAPWLVLAATMPPEHRHEADEHHAQSVTHRHFEAHDHDGAEIDHGEAPIVWLDDSLSVAHAPYQLTVPDAIVPAHCQPSPDLNGWIVASILDASPPHGPPRRYASLRAPPSFSA